MKTLFILNPNAGRQRAVDRVARLIEAAATRAGLAHEIEVSPTPEGVRDIVERANREAVEIVCAVGGDGTVSAIARHLIGTELALGIIPIGSGNGFARHLGIPCDVDRAIGTFREARIEIVDTGTIAGRSFLNVCGIGFDAEVAHAFARGERRGLATYVRESLIALSSRQTKDYELEVDGNTTTQRALVIAFANSGQYGNEARIAPLASLRDGLLDISVVHDASLVRAPHMLYRLFTGSFHRSGSVTVLQGSRIRVTRAEPMLAHVDGDPDELPSTFEVAVNQLSLRVLVPGRTQVF